MAMMRGEAVTFTVQCPGATAPVTGTMDGVALTNAPVLVAGTQDSYAIALTATETDAAVAYLLITDAIGEEYGITIVPDEAAIADAAGDRTLTYRVLLDSNGDGTPDAPAVGVPGVTCVLTSDAAGTQQVGSSKVTDPQGYCTWRGLVAGTYYVWREHRSFNAPNPDIEEVA